MTDPIYYFAYGSNLCRPRLQQRVPSATFMCQGQLLAYQLRFNKVGLDGSGKGNIEQTGNIDDCVWGAVFRVQASEVSHLDKAESLGVGYERLNLRVKTPKGNMSVFTYFALLKDDELRPFHWYKAYVVHGAREHRLPSSYIQEIQAVLSISDPDSQRSQQNTLLPDIAQLNQDLRRDKVQ